MKNMTDKTKRWLTIAGLGIICVALVALIGSRFVTEPPVDDPLPVSDEALEDVNPSPGSEVSVNPNPQTPEQDETGTPAVSSGTEQTIQTDAVKPEYDEDTLTDPSQTPDGEKVSNPQPVEHGSVSAPDTTTGTSQPQGGDTNSNGQVYFPGFGWVDNGGENTGTTVGNQGDELTGNKVGEMD